jgi:cell division septum initiation protein DivIVA
VAGTEGEALGVTEEVTAYSDVGDRIAAILNAAEEAAERIRTTARDEAADILRHAHETGASRVEELTREPERLRDDAARAAQRTRDDADAYSDATREEADAYSHRTHQEADAYSAETRSDAERLARETVASAQRESDELRHAAQQAVREIEEAGRRRQQEIAGGIKALSDLRDDSARRVQEVVAGMRAAAGSLEERVLPFVDPQAAEAAERPAAGILGRLRRRELPEPPVVVEQNGASAADDLYERAKELGIRGRSKMSREELEEAVRQAG